MTPAEERRDGDGCAYVPGELCGAQIEWLPGRTLTCNRKVGHHGVHIRAGMHKDYAWSDEAAAALTSKESRS